MINSQYKTIIITKESKLSFSNNKIIVTIDNKETEYPIYNINMIIFEELSISVSLFLIKELIDNNITIIGCNEKHLPYYNIQAIYGSKNAFENIEKQISWTKNQKNQIWKQILFNKINNQNDLLDNYKLYHKNISFNDFSNLDLFEARNARVYFQTLFGENFSREDDSIINKALNYGYAILVSQISKTIISHGYSTLIGIHHIGKNNINNLSYDVIEPFRPLVDQIVYDNMSSLEDNYKILMISVLNKTIKIGNKKHSVINAIDEFLLSIFKKISKQGNILEVILC